MDLQYLKEVMDAMREKGIAKVEVKEEGVSFSLELALPSPLHHHQPLPPQPHASPVHHHPLPVHHAHVQESDSTKEGTFIFSPMVGTYYSASSPDEPSFVKIGDTVNPDTVVCIIEAMKVMNEVKAGISGTIKELCVDNGHPVEFGSKLFRVE